MPKKKNKETLKDKREKDFFRISDEYNSRIISILYETNTHADVATRNFQKLNKKSELYKKKGEDILDYANYLQYKFSLKNTIKNNSTAAEI